MKGHVQIACVMARRSCLRTTRRRGASPAAFASGCGPGGSRSFPVFSLLFRFCRNYLSPWSFSLMTIRAQLSPCFFLENIRVSWAFKQRYRTTSQLHCGFRRKADTGSEGRRGPNGPKSKKCTQSCCKRERRPLGNRGASRHCRAGVWPVCETDAMVSGMAEIDAKLYQWAQVERRLTELGYRLVEDSWEKDGQRTYIHDKMSRSNT